jgi:hypothetical protein
VFTLFFKKGATNQLLETRIALPYRKYRKRNVSSKLFYALVVKKTPEGFPGDFRKWRVGPGGTRPVPDGE